MLRFVCVEIVVMICEGEKVFCAGALIKEHQLLGLPPLRLPQVVNLHESELRGMAISLDVIVVR
jgi:hypothetical protein